MATSEEHTVLLHGHRVAYCTGESGIDRHRPVLLLVHGMAGSSVTWRAALPALGRHYTVVAPDLLGHGASDKPRNDYSLAAHANRLRDLMVALGIERATVVGHSLGGGIAMQLAYQYPERCERLVLVSSGGLGPEVSWLLRALTLPGAEYVLPYLFPSWARRFGDAVAGRLRVLGLSPRHLEEKWRGYVSLAEPDTRDAFVRTLRSVVDLSGQSVSAHDRLYLACRLPTLIVWGERDHIVPVHHANAAHEAIPGSRLRIFERSGHFPHAEQTRLFVEVVRDFVDTTDAMVLDEEEWRALIATGRPT